MEKERLIFSMASNTKETLNLDFYKVNFIFYQRQRRTNSKWWRPFPRNI